MIKNFKILWPETFAIWFGTILAWIAFSLFGPTEKEQAVDYISAKTGIQTQQVEDALQAEEGRRWLAEELVSKRE